MKRPARIALIATVVLSACRKDVPRVVQAHEFPPGLPAKHFLEAVAIADQAVDSCDRLLALEDCYDSPEDTSEQKDIDRSKAVPTPSVLFGGADNLQFFEAVCRLDNPQEKTFRSCNSPVIDRPRRLRRDDCNNAVPYGSWPVLEHQSVGETVHVPIRPTCPEAWVQVEVHRRSRKGALLEVIAVFVNRTPAGQ